MEDAGEIISMCFSRVPFTNGYLTIKDNWSGVFGFIKVLCCKGEQVDSRLLEEVYRGTALMTYRP